MMAVGGPDKRMHSGMAEEMRGLQRGNNFRQKTHMAMGTGQIRDGWKLQRAMVDKRQRWVEGGRDLTILRLRWR